MKKTAMQWIRENKSVPQDGRSLQDAKKFLRERQEKIRAARRSK